MGDWKKQDPIWQQAERGSAMPLSEFDTHFVQMGRSDYACLEVMLGDMTTFTASEQTPRMARKF